MQADALKLVGKKLQSSMAVQRELPEEGLAAFGDDLMLALARKIVSGDEDDAETVEATAGRSSKSSRGRSRSTGTGTATRLPR